MALGWPSTAKRCGYCEHGQTTPAHLLYRVGDRVRKEITHWSDDRRIGTIVRVIVGGLYEVDWDRGAGRSIIDETTKKGPTLEILQ